MISYVPLRCNAWQFWGYKSPFGTPLAALYDACFLSKYAT